ncbi:translation initiation factor eIF-2B subunit delta-like isoform X1 [Gossypium australe]|uniref:Translation initiation factor eIF2B subunit delta n=2 Tax=Gossypium TaxID=3633 RepID=A0A5B6UFV6_9ROSI|nr:translation initiation factor eIF-2B subunit delta-like isoform X1 [Gossypium australe]
MDARRLSRAVPRVRQVGFFTPNTPAQQPRPQSAAPSSESPPLSDSPASNSLSPVMIPPPRHLSDNLGGRTAAVPVPGRENSGELPTVGSYNPSESVLWLDSPPHSRIGDEELSEGAESSLGWYRRSNSAKFASSLPSGGFNLSTVKHPESVAAVEAKNPLPEKSEAQKEQASSSKPLKAKTTKAERRALQESQRAAKAASKVRNTEANKSGTPGGAPSSKSMKQPPQKKDGPPVASSIAASERIGVDRSVEKERKKDLPPPRKQFDDESRGGRAKRRSVLNQPEARNRVELFRHLPPHKNGTQLPYLESKFFELHEKHPAVYKVGLQYLAGDLSGGNARCIAMLQAFQEAIRDYSTPPEKTLTRDLTSKIGGFVSFLIECRPLSMSMGNAIRFLKSRIARLPLTLSESEAKTTLCSDIDRFINEKIVLADKVILRHAATKIRDGDVLLTYGSSCVVEMILLYAHELGKQFRVVVVDSHPMLEGQKLLRRLVVKGLSCTYTQLNAISYVMHEVTRVFLGASSIFSNGTVYSTVGTASVAMVAHAFRVPVLVCCDPDAISKVPGRVDVNYLDNLTDKQKENLELLNLKYDATPSDYISVIVTDYGMILIHYIACATDPSHKCACHCARVSEGVLVDIEFSHVFAEVKLLT